MSKLELSAKDIMFPRPLCIEPHQTVRSAIELMLEAKTGSILVTKNEKLVGIFTERDVLTKGLQNGFFESPIEMYMTPNPGTISESECVEDIYREFSNASYRHLPVVRDERPVGMISMRDLIKVWASYVENERNRLAQEYERAMSIIVHDLRSPISAIRAINELLLLAVDNPDNFVEGGFPELIDNSCGTMLDLINDLLEISTIKSGEIVLEKSENDFSEIAKRVVESMRPSAETKQIELLYENNLSQNRFLFDGRRMTQALTNLLSNAIKYSDNGLPVEFVVSEVEKNVRVQVIDHGQGIPEEEIPKLFEELAKISSKPTAGEASTGLGLSITKKLIEAHGGTIAVSSNPYEKTEFCITIPIIAKELQAAS